MKWWFCLDDFSQESGGTGPILLASLNLDMCVRVKEYTINPAIGHSLVADHP